MRTCCLRILVAAVGWEEELLPPPLSLLGEGEGTVEEERRGQSSRFKGPGSDGKLGAALEASGMDGRLVSAIGLELGSALGVSGMDGTLGLALGMELGAGLEASGMDCTLGLALGMELHQIHPTSKKAYYRTRPPIH